MIEKCYLHLVKYVFINPLSAKPTKWFLWCWHFMGYDILVYFYKSKVFEIIKIDAPAKKCYGCFTLKFNAWKIKATEVRNKRATKSSYKTELRKMTPHFELLAREFL